ncbi:TetR/AcrR family transcriptional regulator [Clostridium botulinum]|uniref:TetR/AcrR family transcriptional regulator n=1 Tax=Clostridium botulinum TaxID=1491 RepID=UPI003DA22F07
MAGIVKKPEVRKDELLNVAEKLFIEKGYENTSVKDIYAEVNGSFGMFYHHFKSKEEVLEEVNKKMLARDLNL